MEIRSDQSGLGLGGEFVIDPFFPFGEGEETESVSLSQWPDYGDLGEPAQSVT